MINRKKIPLVYVIYFVMVIILWAWYMYVNNGFILFKKHWIISVTMIFGSFIAGISSEGGGAIAYPVFTLLLDVSPSVAKNFSFAIQSVGMTAASLLILGYNMPIEKKVVLYASIGGVIGLVLGTFTVSKFIYGVNVKLFFVSIWLSFAFALFLLNKDKKRIVYKYIEKIAIKDKVKLIGFGFLGGLISALFGNGIDIFTFCLLTLFYRLNEKTATTTSIIIMSINTIIGFTLHFYVLKDFQELAFEYWMVAIPIVIIFAPIGSYTINFLSRKSIAYILYTIISIQYIGALFILKLSVKKLIFSSLIIFIGLLFFWYLSKRGKIINRNSRIQKKRYSL